MTKRWYFICNLPINSDFRAQHFQ